MSLCCKMKKLTRIMNVQKHKEGLGRGAAFLCTVGKGEPKGHPTGKAGSGMCNPISHCNTSRCPSAALGKGNQYSTLCHNRQAALGTALQGQELTFRATVALRDPW